MSQQLEDKADAKDCDALLLGKSGRCCKKRGSNRPAMPSMSEEGEEEEESRQELGPADQAGHCLGVDWVRGKEQGGHEGS